MYEMYEMYFLKGILEIFAQNVHSRKAPATPKSWIHILNESKKVELISAIDPWVLMSESWVVNELENIIKGLCDD